jgi:hypothetical protein
VVVKPPHRRVVAGFRPYEQVRERRRRRLLGEEVLKDRGCKLAAAAAAMGKRRQANDGSVHSAVSFVS